MIFFQKLIHRNPLRYLFKMCFVDTFYACFQQMPRIQLTRDISNVLGSHRQCKVWIKVTCQFFTEKFHCRHFTTSSQSKGSNEASFHVVTFCRDCFFQFTFSPNSWSFRITALQRQPFLTPHVVLTLDIAKPTSQKTY